MHFNISVKIKLLIIAVIFSLMSLVLTNLTMAADIPIEGWVSGDISMTLQGAWYDGLNFSNVEKIPGYEQDENSLWNGNDQVDFLNIVDNTATTGFYIAVDVSDFQYTGTDPYQQSLAASNMTIFGNYQNDTPAIIGSGYDSPNKELSILPDSCAGATLDKFTWHPDFENSQKNYSLIASTSSQTLISSVSECAVVAHLRFDHLEIFIPSAAANGDYMGTVTFTIFDGL